MIGMQSVGALILFAVLGAVICAKARVAGGAIVRNGRAYPTGGDAGDLLRVHGRGGLPCVTQSS